MDNQWILDGLRRCKPETRNSYALGAIHGVVSTWEGAEEIVATVKMILDALEEVNESELQNTEGD